MVSDMFDPALLAALALAGASPTPLLVVPFAALQGDVPARAGDKLAALLAEELKTQGGPATTVASAPPRDGGAAALEVARAEVKRGRELITAGKPGAAAEVLAAAVDKLWGPAAPAVAAVELADALGWLARARFQGADDAGGKAALIAAAKMSPGRALPAEEGSPQFTALATRERTQALVEKGGLRVDSVPSGAACELDGHDIGRTPLLIQSVPVGDHLIKVSFPSGDVWATKVSIGKGDTAKVSAVAGGGGPGDRLAAGLAQNRVTPEALAAAKALLEESKAGAVLFGGLSRGGKGINADAFVLARGGDLRRLPRASVDGELLGAGTDLVPLLAGLAALPTAPAVKPGEQVAPEVMAAEDRPVSHDYPTGIPDKRPDPSGPRKVVRRPVTETPATEGR
jgi:hypothetical protein